MFKKVMSAIIAAALFTTCLTGCNTKPPMEKPSAEDQSGSMTAEAQSKTEVSPAEQTTDQNSQVQKSEAQPITIQFWNAFTGSDGEILREIVNRFNEENQAGITIEMDIMPGSTLLEKLAPALTTNTAPALLLQGNMDVAFHAKNGNILPMDDFFDVTGADQKDIMPAALEGLRYEGTQYMIPMQWFTQYLYYNKDLFEKAGIDKVPDTWEEVAAAAEKITDPDQNVYGLGIAVGGAVPWFDSLLLSNGGKILSDDLTKSELNTEENIASIKAIQDLVNQGYATKGTTGADLDNIMMADQLGMVINGPWMVAGLKESEINFGVAKLPMGSTARVGISEITGFSIPKGTSEEAKAAAYEFIAYWNSTEVCKEWSLRNGFPPYLNSVAADQEVKSNELVNEFSAISEYGQPFGTGLTCAAAINSEILFPCIENIVAGADVAKELQKASDQIDLRIAEE